MGRMRLDFRGPNGDKVSPKRWLRLWAARYPVEKYEAEHDTLIVKRGRLSSADFVRIGKWKDAAHTPARWKPNVASVAYDIWLTAASESPACPDENSIEVFLLAWSERTYRSRFGSRRVDKRFGLSRATTLLYFLSGGRFPIFDSRVRRAVKRLRNVAVPNTVISYLESYCPLFDEIAAQSGTKDRRMLDQALFSYGGKNLPFSDNGR